MSTRPTAARDIEPVPEGRRQWLMIALASLAVLAACVIVVWLAVTAVSGASDAAVDRRETIALKQGWQASYDAILPLAKDFTTKTGGGLDAAAYGSRIASARRVVDAISDVPVTLQDNRDIRDSTLSGASRILDGMDTLLQAASKDDTAGVETALIDIDGGITTLGEAGAALDAKIKAKGWR